MKTSKMNQNDVDWRGILTAGEVIGNLLRISKPAQLQRELKFSPARVRILFQKKDGLRFHLQQLKTAFERIDEEKKTLMQMNAQLNRELSEKNKMILRLHKKHSSRIQ